MDMEDAIRLGTAYCAQPPTYEEWMARRDTFMGFGLKYYNCLSRENLLLPPEKFRVLERELERAYCSGTHLSCVLLAWATIEILLNDVNANARKQIHVKLEYIGDQMEELRQARKKISHYIRAPDDVTLDDYIYLKGDLMNSARSACAMVYHVARAYIHLDPVEALRGTVRERRQNSL